MYATIVYKLIDTLYICLYNNTLIIVEGPSGYQIGDCVILERFAGQSLYHIKYKINKYTQYDVPLYILSEFNIDNIRSNINKKLSEKFNFVYKIPIHLTYPYDFLPTDTHNLNQLDVGFIKGSVYSGLSAGKSKLLLCWFQNKFVHIFDTSLIITPNTYEFLTYNKGESTNFKFYSIYPWEKDGYENYDDIDKDQEPQSPILNRGIIEGYLSKGKLEFILDPYNKKSLFLEHKDNKGQYKLFTSNFFIYKTLIQRIPLIEHLQNYIFFNENKDLIWESDIKDISIEDNTFWHPDTLILTIEDILREFRKRKGFVFIENNINERLSNTLQEKFELDEPPVEQITYDKNKDQINIHQGTAGIRTTDDGGIIIEDAYGGQIILSKGNIYISCPGDTFILPGRNVINMAGNYIVLKCNNHIEISSLSKNVYLRCKDLYCYMKENLFLEGKLLNFLIEKINFYLSFLYMNFNDGIILIDKISTFYASIKNIFIKDVLQLIVKFSNGFFYLTSSILAFTGGIISQFINLLRGLISGGGIIARGFASPGKAFGKVGEAKPDLGQAKQILNVNVEKIISDIQENYQDIASQVVQQDKIKFKYDTKAEDGFCLREFKWQNMMGGQELSEESINDTMSYPGKELNEKEGTFLTCNNQLNNYNDIKWDKLQKEDGRWTLQTIKKTIKQWIVSKK